MKKGIRCNSTRFDSREHRDRIQFEFLTDDEITPSACTVKIGDIDTVTGEPVTDLYFFSEYYKEADAQVRQNLKAERRESTKREKVRREEETKRFVESFRSRWGYAPSKTDILDHLEKYEQEHWNLSVSVLVNEAGKDHTFQHAEFSTPMETEEDIPVELQALRDVAASLTGRKAEVYEAMIQRAAGGKERLRFSDIADKYGVTPGLITKDQEIIMAMVRRRAKEMMEED